MPGMNIRALLTTVAIAGGSVYNTHSQLLTYDFDAASPNPTSVADGVSGGAFELTHSEDGPLEPVFYVQDSGHAIGDTRWNVAEGEKWWSFTVTANPGTLFSLSSLVFSDRATASGPTDWTVFINNIGVAFGSTSQVGSGQLGEQSIDLTPFDSDLSGIDFAEVQIFGYGGSGGSGTWRIDDVILHGEGPAIAPVPEPGTWALLGLGMITLLLHRRART